MKAQIIKKMWDEAKTVLWGKYIHEMHILEKKIKIWNQYPKEIIERRIISS